MNPCALNRLLLPAFLVGMVVSSAAGSDGYGLIAAAATIAIILALRKVRGTAPTCAISPAPGPAQGVDQGVDEELSDRGRPQVPAR